MCVGRKTNNTPDRSIGELIAGYRKKILCHQQDLATLISTINQHLLRSINRKQRSTQKVVDESYRHHETLSFDIVVATATDTGPMDGAGGIIICILVDGGRGGLCVIGQWLSLVVPDTRLQ